MRKIKKAIQKAMQAQKGKPINKNTLFKQLDLPRSKFKIFLKAWRSVEEDTTQGKKPQRNKNLASGLMHLSTRGFGFVEVQDKKMDDVFIPKHQTMGAMDGDLVTVAFFPGRKGKGPEGKVLSIEKRKRKEFVAIITAVTNQKAIGIASFLAENQNIEIDLNNIKVKIHDRVLVDIKQFPTNISSFKCKAIKNIGSMSDPSVDTLAAIKDFGLKSEFPKDVIQEAKTFGKSIDKEALKNRKDLTKKITLTIDPTTAKDYDDAITIEKDTKGNFELGVHIADVAHYVKVGSKLDIEALKRCNSTYFPSEVVPMIPFELSNELCSLKPDVIRLTMSVMMRFDKTGKLLSHDIFRSYILSDKRLTYEEALDILENREKSPYKKQLDLMLELTKQLKKHRSERGSVEFGLPEAVVLVDKKGVPKGIHITQYDITHQMIEEFMLKANEMVATHLTTKQLKMIYRVHEAPSADDYREFVAMAHALNIKLPAHPKSEDISKALNSIDDPLIAKTLAIHYIRSMKLAIYAEDNIGHFGLSLENYCHFTSPIRRYSDLVVQRLIAKETPANHPLATVAKMISEQERVSAKAENSVSKLKKLRLLLEAFTKDPKRQYDAIITHIKPKGIIFELQGLMMEGFLPLKALDQSYVFAKKEIALLGKSKRDKIALFTPLTVSLKEVNIISQATVFELVAIDK